MLRKSMVDYQQAGTGGIIFMGFLQAITLPLSYEQRKTSYRGLYSLIVGKIEEDPKYKQDESISILISGVKLLIDQAGKDYRASFESHSNYSELENNYCELLAQIFDRLTQIAIKTKIIEKVTVEQEVVG